MLLNENLETIILSKAGFVHIMLCKVWEGMASKSSGSHCDSSVKMRHFMAYIGGRLLVQLLIALSYGLIIHLKIKRKKTVQNLEDDRWVLKKEKKRKNEF